MGPSLQAKLSLAQHFEPVSLNQSFCDVGSLWARMNLQHFPKTEARPATLEISPRSRLLKRGKKKKQKKNTFLVLHSRSPSATLWTLQELQAGFTCPYSQGPGAITTVSGGLFMFQSPHYILKCILRSLFHNPTRKSMQCWLTFSTVNFFLWYNFVSWV